VVPAPVVRGGGGTTFDDRPLARLVMLPGRLLMLSFCACCLLHYARGADLVDDFAAKKRRVLDAARVRAVTQPWVTRERCRLRRLRVS
jgi:hypothetical protein